jgi:hypothetical protein
MRRSLAVVFVIAASLAGSLAACSKKNTVDPGPACPKVVDNMLVVMKQAYAGHDTVELANRDQMIAQCEQRKMPPRERKCLAEAKNVSDLASCRSTKPGSPGAPPTPTRPLPTGVAPAAGVAPEGSAAPQPAPAGSAQ